MAQIWRDYCLMQQNSKVPGVVFNQGKLPEIVHKIPVYSSALRNKIFVRTWIFFSTLFVKQVSEPF